MRMSEMTNELSQAFFQIQQRLQPVVKDARNTFVGNAYATVEGGYGILSGTSF